MTCRLMNGMPWRTSDRYGEHLGACLLRARGVSRRTPAGFPDGEPYDGDGHRHRPGGLRRRRCLCPSPSPYRARNWRQARRMSKGVVLFPRILGRATKLFFDRHVSVFTASANGARLGLRATRDNLGDREPVRRRYIQKYIRRPTVSSMFRIT